MDVDEVVLVSNGTPPISCLASSNIDRQDRICVDEVNLKSNSHAVAHTELVPIVARAQDFFQSAGFSSTPTVLVNENKSDDEFKPGSALEDSSKRNGDVDFTVYSTFSNPFATDQNMTLGEDVYNADFTEVSSLFCSATECLPEETFSAFGSFLDEEDVDLKPTLEELDVYANETASRHSLVANVVIEFPEETIKQEFSNLPSCSHPANTEDIIKTENEDKDDCDMVDDETGKKGDSSSTNDLTSIEQFLTQNPDILTKFSGLPNLSMFHALLDYIKNDLEPKKGVTKFEQLFSVLAKLHQNEDNLYLNKYLFPAVYVLVVELLHKKLQVLCNDSPGFSELPELLMPEFDRSQKVAIVGIIKIYVRSKNPAHEGSRKTVKYLIGYTVFGEIFFVSNAFVSTTNTIKLINYCGILDKLSKESWVLVQHGGNVCVGPVRKIASKKRWLRNRLLPIISESIEQHTMNVVNRLCQRFKVLETVMPDFMLHSKKDICFLDKLVFVCCMLLNMLPRCIYA